MYSQDSRIAEIHAGNFFTYQDYTTVAAASTLILLGKVGSTPVHFQDYFLKSDLGDFNVVLYEAPTLTANGSAITSARNRNRSSVKTPTLGIYSGPTVTDNGTVLFKNRTPTVGSGSHTQGGEISLPTEWILSPNTDYLIIVTNENAGDAINISFGFDWLEKAV